MKKFTTTDWLYNLFITGIITAAIGLIVKLSGHEQEACVALWIMSLLLVTPYIIFKKWRQEKWTTKDFWPWAVLAAICIIYLIINNK